MKIGKPPFRRKRICLSCFCWISFDFPTLPNKPFVLLIVLWFSKFNILNEKTYKNRYILALFIFIIFVRIISLYFVRNSKILMIDRNSFISNYPRSQITHDIDYYWLFELVQIIYKIYRTIYGTDVLDDDDESRSIVCPWVYRSRRGRGPLRFISLGKWILLNSTSCDSNNYTIDVTQLPSNIDPILSILTLLPSTRIFHASHFPSLSLSRRRIANRST